MKPLSKSLAHIDTKYCVACGCCLKVCPRQALSIYKGCYAAVRQEACVGCGQCVRECPAGVITLASRSHLSETNKKGERSHE